MSNPIPSHPIPSQIGFDSVEMPPTPDSKMLGKDYNIIKGGYFVSPTLIEIPNAKKAHNPKKGVCFNEAFVPILYLMKGRASWFVRLLYFDMNE